MEKAALPKFAVHVGPATIRHNYPYLRIAADQIEEFNSPEEIQEVVDNINHPYTSEQARNFMNCATCKAANYIQSTPDQELNIQASVRDLTQVNITAGCQVLVYAHKNGFVQDAECMKAKKPIHVVVGAKNQPFSFWKTLNGLLNK